MKETSKLHWLKIDQEIKAQNSSVCVFVYSLTCNRMRNTIQYSQRIRIILKQKRKSSVTAVSGQHSARRDVNKEIVIALNGIEMYVYILTFSTHRKNCAVNWI
jgi:hypothetical protein